MTATAAIGYELRALSTGAPTLDDATGIGGFPRGRVVEVFGPECAGKTTIALHAIAAAQRAGHVCAYLDEDRALDTAYAKAIGVDVAHMLISQPSTWEQGLDMVEMLARSGACDLVVLDSLERTRVDPHSPEHGIRARKASQVLRQLTAIAYRTGVTIVFINRTSGGYAGPFGNAIKFYASMRLDVRRMDVEAPGLLRVIVAKNKHAAPYGHADLRIAWGAGFVAE